MSLRGGLAALMRSLTPLARHPARTARPAASVLVLQRFSSSSSGGSGSGPSPHAPMPSTFGSFFRSARQLSKKPGLLVFGATAVSAGVWLAQVGRAGGAAPGGWGGGLAVSWGRLGPPRLPGGHKLAALQNASMAHPCRRASGASRIAG